MNAVETLLMRIKISDAIPAFRKLGIEKIVQLRALTQDQLKEAVPNDEQRAALLEAINNRGSAQQKLGPAAINTQPPRYHEDDGAGRGNGDGGMRGRGGRGGRGGSGYARRDGDNGVPHTKSRVCRQFFAPEGTCKYNDQCKYSHDPEMLQKEQQEGGSGSGSMPGYRSSGGTGSDERPRASYSEVFLIPSDTVKFLLGNKAEKLRQIHEMCHTSNEKPEKPTGFTETFPLTLFGAPENVARAKAEILKAVGVKNLEDQKARFEFANNELQYNTRAATLLAASNIKSAAANNGLALSESTLQRVIATFRFEEKQQIHHFWSFSSISDKEKLEEVGKIVSQMKGVQAILFTEASRVTDMSKNPGRTSRAFHGVKPHFMTREMDKKERMEALEAFKNGEPNEHGVRQRLLVTTADYAKFARKTLIPFVNLVVHFSIPKTKETYLIQSLCAGRHSTHGASLIFVTAHDNPTFKEWEQSIKFEDLKEEQAFARIVPSITYDTVSSPLTTADADPPANWQALLQKEMEEKAAKKSAPK